jgi:hypothetical protein
MSTLLYTARYISSNHQVLSSGGSNIYKIAEASTTGLAYQYENSNALFRYKFGQVPSSQYLHWQTSNITLSTALTPTFAIEPVSLVGFSNQNTGVTGCGGFFQSTVGNRPVFTSNQGYQNGANISFTSANNQFLFDENLQLNINRNGGCTICALVNMNNTAVANEAIFDLSQSTTGYSNNVRLARIGTTANLRFEIYNGVSSEYMIAENAITQNEWSLYTVILGSNQGSFQQFMINGQVVTSRYADFNRSDITFSYNYVGRTAINTAGTPAVYANMNLGGLYMYDRMLTDNEVNAVHNYILQGNTISKSRLNNVLSANPFTRNDTLGAMRGPAHTLECNSGVRVNAIPMNPSFAADIFTPSVLMKSTSMPYPDSSNACFTFNRSSSQYINFGTTVAPLLSKGFSMVVEASFNDANVANEPAFEINNGLTNGSMVSIYRYAQTARIGVDVWNATATMKITAVTPGDVVTYGQPLLIAVVIDPTASNYGSISLYIDGVLQDVEYNARFVLSDRTLNNTWIGGSSVSGAYLNGSVYHVSMYNRPLTPAEIANLYVLMNRDVPRLSFDVGGRSGASMLCVKADGNVGIGTVNPAWTLDILGDMKLVGTVVRTQLLLQAKAWYSFQSVTSASITDDTGNGNTAYMTGPSYSVITETINNTQINSLQITSDGVTTLSAPFVASAGAKTLMFWIKTTRSGGNANQLAIGFYNPTTNPSTAGVWFSLQFGIQSYYDLSYNGYNNNWANGSATNIWVSVGKWVHVTLTMDAGYGIQMYINGVSFGKYYTVNSIQYSTTATTYYYRKFLGAATDTSNIFRIQSVIGTNQVVYSFRNVLYYDRCLSDEEIYALYACT